MTYSGAAPPFSLLHERVGVGYKVSLLHQQKPSTFRQHHSSHLIQSCQRVPAASILIAFFALKVGNPQVVHPVPIRESSSPSPPLSQFGKHPVKPLYLNFSSYSPHSLREISSPILSETPIQIAILKIES